MKRSQARRMEAATRQQLERLMQHSELQHGADYVRFSPLWRDYLSRRRRRLVRAYHALRAGHYVKG